MSPPLSDLFSVLIFQNAGRGIVASQHIYKDTIVLDGEPPLADVIFRPYRKEVCAQCFLYDCGRTLFIRDYDTGKVFCSQECRGQWVDEVGDAGRKAWQSLHAFVQAKSKAMTNTNSRSPTRGRPASDEIVRCWSQAEAEVQVQRSTPSQAKIPGRKRIKSASNGCIDPDVLGYLLSGVVSHHQQPDLWQKSVLALAMHEEPYTSPGDLEAHCNSFVQLASIVPVELRGSCESGICRALAGASSHNAFGIRSGSEDGEEYMGYALYPSVSYFNHSCSPNLSKQRVGNAWRFCAAKDIQEGEQLCISYLGGDERTLDLTERRARLREVWNFVCECERCQREAKLWNDGSHTRM